MLTLPALSLLHSLLACLLSISLLHSTHFPSVYFRHFHICPPFLCFYCLSQLSHLILITSCPRHVSFSFSISVWLSSTGRLSVYLERGQQVSERQLKRERLQRRLKKPCQTTSWVYFCSQWVITKISLAWQPDRRHPGLSVHMWWYNKTQIKLNNPSTPTTLRMEFESWINNTTSHYK